jgi:muramoyltetrapeptide carboxypeptidase
MPRILMIAASSVVPEVEFAIGVEHLRSRGLEVTVHPQVLTQHWLHAGTDASRANALFDAAMDAGIDIVYCARGGYGAAKLLPLLDRLTAERGRPLPKTLVGYSDVTVLHQYVRDRWGWRTIHAPMPAAGNFPTLPAHDMEPLLALLGGQAPTEYVWEQSTLDWITPPPESPIDAELIGGNLALWQTLAGTPYAPPRRPHILFLEDIGEKFYRIDRMMTHLDQSGLLDTTAAVVLGDFTDCDDETQTCRASREDSGLRRPLRPTFGMSDLLREVFREIGLRRNLPICVGLPVGHGPHFAPLPLGERYRLTPAGRLSRL